VNDTSGAYSVFRTLTGPLRRLRHSYRESDWHTILSLSAIRRVVRTGFNRLLGRSDYARWSDPQNLEAWWEARSQRMASLVPNHARVIEFGAGSGRLRAHLDQSCDYIPSDIVERAPGTVICDLNRQPLPNLGHLGADVAIFAGVLEYIGDIERVVAWLAQFVEQCIVSYDCVPRETTLLASIRERLRRRYYGYHSDLTEAKLLEIFRDHGFAPIHCDSWTNQRIFAFARSTKPSEKL
jgi:hypothetical protein